MSNVTSQISQNLKSQIFDIHFDQLSNGNSEIQQLSVTYIAKARGLTAYRYHAVKSRYNFIFVNLFAEIFRFLFL